MNSNRIVMDGKHKFVFQVEWGLENLYYCKELNQYMGINRETGFKKKYEAGNI